MFKEYFQRLNILFTSEKQNRFLNMFKSKTRKSVNLNMLCFIIVLIVIWNGLEI